MSLPIGFSYRIRFNRAKSRWSHTSEPFLSYESLQLLSWRVDHDSLLVIAATSPGCFMYIPLLLSYPIFFWSGCAFSIFLCNTNYIRISMQRLFVLLMSFIWVTQVVAQNGVSMKTVSEAGTLHDQFQGESLERIKILKLKLVE